MQEDEQIFAAGCSETQKQVSQKSIKSPHSFCLEWKEVVPDLWIVFVECWRTICSLDCNVWMLMRFLAFAEIPADVMDFLANSMD